MTDYSKLVEALRYCVSGVCKNCSYFDKCKENGTAMDQLHNDAAAAIEALQAQLPKRGEWILKERAHYFKCSICKEPIPYKFGYGGNRYYNFCPRCGAKMEVQG